MKHPRIQYWCMECEQTFADGRASNAHHAETGHRQSFRCPAENCGRALSQHSEGEYDACMRTGAIR